MLRSIVLLLVVVLSACASTEPGGGEGGVISGTVIYRERMALPPQATVTVRLEDVSRMDVAADVLAESRFPAESGPPFAFRLDYDPAEITEGRRYALRASIHLEDRLLFTNTEHIPAFGHEGDVEILVRRTGG